MSYEMFHSDRSHKFLKISNFFLVCFQNFIINRENLIKIGRAGSKTSNRETLDQIGNWNIWLDEKSNEYSKHALDLGVITKTLLSYDR